MMTIRQTYKRIPKKSELLFVYNALTAKGDVDSNDPLQVCRRRRCCDRAPSPNHAAATLTTIRDICAA